MKFVKDIQKEKENDHCNECKRLSQKAFCENKGLLQKFGIRRDKNKKKKGDEKDLKTNPLSRTVQVENKMFN